MNMYSQNLITPACSSMYAGLQKIVYGAILSTNSRDLGLMTVCGHVS